MPSTKRTFWNGNTPTPLKLPKGKLIKINWKEHEQEVKRLWEGKPPTKKVEQWKQEALRSNQEQYYHPGTIHSRMDKIRRLIGYNGNNLVGYCSKCKNLNTHILKQ